MSTNPGRNDKYELQELLARDAVAEVWKAFDTQARRYVAIKFLRPNLQADPGFVTRFQRETGVIGSLSHPNIVQYYDFSILQVPETGGITASLVMNFVDGGTLADYIRNTSHQGKFLPGADIVRLFIPIVNAVEYAHERGVIHGQLKPANILLDKRATSRNVMGEPIVTDFGILKLLTGGASGGDNTSSWHGGVPLYSSPEQITGSPADVRSDIYSLGIMLYEICTGTPPFSGNNPAMVMMQHVNTIPALPSLINPGLPTALTTIIMRCIAKDPWARFPTAASLQEALTQAAGQEGQEAATMSMPMNANQPDYSVKSMDLPTVFSSGQHPSLPGVVSSASMPSSLPGISNPSFPSLTPSVVTSGGVNQGGQSPYYYTVSSSNPAGASQPYNVLPPGGQMMPFQSAYAPGQSPQSLPGISAAPPTQVLPPQKPVRKRRQTLWILLSLLLILVVVGSGLVAYFNFFSKGSSSTATTPTIVGHAYFTSSGLLGPDTGSNSGITDQLQVGLNNVPPPPQGKVYYAWLLNDITLDWKPVALGQLTVNNGTAVLSFPGDAQHSDLLAVNSRFFVTEEDAGSVPANPSINAGALRYYAEFSQVPDPNNSKHYSLYDHIRHLLADDPKVKAAGLTGGLDIWLYRNSETILEWANSARDAQQGGDIDFIHRQLTRIIDYLDGTYYDQHDLPGQKLLVEPTVAKIGLLTFDPVNQDPPGYLTHIGTHLHDITALPQATANQKALANQIYQAINGVNVLYQTVRSEVLKLYSMSPTQLFGNDGRVLLNDVATLANNAFVGQIGPQGQIIDGIAQIHYAIQQLATFDVRACTTSNACPSLAS